MWNYIIICVLIIIILYLYVGNKYATLSYISNANENFKVKVDTSKQNSVMASILLAQCVENMIKLRKFLKEKYSLCAECDNLESIDILEKKKKRLDIDPTTYSRIYRFLSRFNEDSFTENNPKNSSEDTSYNEDKGNKIAICLRDPKTGEFHNLNSLIFVCLHEIAHSLTISFGHDDSFWYNFKWLLENAVECGIYYPIDYKKHPEYYCGLDISFQPLFDM